MSINGVGANGQVVQNIETKKIAKEAGKGSLMGAIGNLLNGSRKAEAMEQPMKGWSLEHTGTGNVSGSVTTQTVESKPQTPNKPKEIRQPEFKGLENLNNFLTTACPITFSSNLGSNLPFIACSTSSTNLYIIS